MTAFTHRLLLALLLMSLSLNPALAAVGCVTDSASGATRIAAASAVAEADERLPCHDMQPSANDVSVTATVDNGTDSNCKQCCIGGNCDCAAGCGALMPNLAPNVAISRISRSVTTALAYVAPVFRSPENPFRPPIA